MPYRTLKRIFAQGKLPFDYFRRRLIRKRKDPVEFFNHLHNRFCVCVQLEITFLPDAQIQLAVRLHRRHTGRNLISYRKLAKKFPAGNQAGIAVDDCYSGLIPGREFFGQVSVGDQVEARVTAVKPDGKLDLSIREKGYVQMNADAERVMKAIEEFDGVLPFTDKASPEVIKRELSLSKNAFKRAVGHLLKEGRIEITEKSIRKL